MPAIEPASACLYRDGTLLATTASNSVLHGLAAGRQHAFAYMPYGNRHPVQAALHLPGFNGERPEPVTGHYLLGNGYRAFNPILMRFNSPDSLSPFGEGGLNAYGYCAGDPVNKVDSNGHLPALLKVITRIFKPSNKAFRQLSIASKSSSSHSLRSIETHSTYLSSSSLTNSNTSLSVLPAPQPPVANLRPSLKLPKSAPLPSSKSETYFQRRVNSNKLADVLSTETTRIRTTKKANGQDNRRH